MVAALVLAEHDEHLRQRSVAVRTAVGTEVHRRLLPLLGEDGVLISADVAKGCFVFAIPDAAPHRIRRRLHDLARDVAPLPVLVEDGSEHSVQAGVGWARYERCRVDLAMLTTPGRLPEDVVHVAIAAAGDSLRQRDLVAKAATDTDPRRRVPTTRRLAAQIAGSIILSSVLPWLLLVGAHALGVDLGDAVYVVVVASLVLTAALLINESLHAYTPAPLPPRPDGPPPRASAIIAAYLPNEAATIGETIRHFLRQDYPGGLEIVLAYNRGPDDERLPVEDELARLAARCPQLRLLHVRDSTSKAQNINAALTVVTGEFVGIFDADHHPMRGAFERAWHWLGVREGGHVADVVQGHCVVRNSADSFVASTVAAEFEQIYAVAHPGRTAMHGFGVFGGSNGFWRTEVLRRIRLRADRLTEDIDGSIRALLAGHTITTDPGLVSRELAPVSLPALWRQRSRWAQGWFEVSLHLLLPALRSRRLSARQKVGVLSLLAWRELSPWLSALPLPLIAYFYWRDGTVDWSTALFVVTALYTMSAGPVQAFTAWRLAVPELRWRAHLFLPYILVTALIYSELKNLIVRVAQIKHLMGERHWAVTPRTASAPALEVSAAAVPAQRRRVPAQVAS